MEIFIRNRQLVVNSAAILTTILIAFLSSQLDLRNFKNIIYFFPVIVASYIFYQLILFINELILINLYSDILKKKGLELAGKMLKGNVSTHQSTTGDLVERSALNCIISYLKQEETDV
jgi:hypothetical protein